ncbi:hypothetical protein MK805_06160 [Shimazuella sp. AN120528]|uniref:hypothetical protein n=1 Tax=Shimazuella soli TaxID=1892854 RepID=UPI001F0D7DA5|nr:hypothetical protein [Shimazuella soli]MCH5584553.1 hypothetical protein [Shimazuella soli]
MDKMNDFHLHMKKQKAIWTKSFSHDSSGYLGIVEVPHAFDYATITSNISLEHFIEEISKFPYHYAWKVSELQKVTAFVDTILPYIDQLGVSNRHLEDKMFDLLIAEIDPYLIEEVDPYN